MKKSLKHAAQLFKYTSKCLLSDVVSHFTASNVWGLILWEKMKANETRREQIFRPKVFNTESKLDQRNPWLYKWAAWAGHVGVPLRRPAGSQHLKGGYNNDTCRINAGVNAARGRQYAGGLNHSPLMSYTRCCASSRRGSCTPSKPGSNVRWGPSQAAVASQTAGLHACWRINTHGDCSC